MSTRVASVSQSENGGSCGRFLPRVFYLGSADKTRQTLKSRPEVELATTGEELLLRQPCRRSAANT